MHVGFRTECLNSRYTGVEFHAHALVEGVKKAGHQVTCFHTPNSNHPSFEGVNHHLFRKPLPLPLRSALSAFFHTHCFDCLDILHLPNPQIAYIKKPACPVVMTVHDIIPMLTTKYHSFKQAVFFRKLLPQTLKKVDAICSSSENTKKDIMKFYKIDEEKIHVVPLSIKTVKPQKRKPSQTILYLGTLEPRKNVEGIIRAFAKVKQNRYPHKLVIAGGKGWNYDDIFRIVRELKLDNDVTFKGYVTEEEKEQLYQEAEVFVWPSFYEGFGLPVLEAMARGVPIVTSDTSSLPEVVGNAGILVNPHSIESIAEGIIQVISSKHAQNTLAKKGFKQAKKFTPEQMIKKTITVYEELL